MTDFWGGVLAGLLLATLFWGGVVAAVMRAARGDDFVVEDDGG